MGTNAVCSRRVRCRVIPTQHCLSAIFSDLQHASPGQISHGLITFLVEAADALVGLVEVGLDIGTIHFEPTFGVGEESYLVRQRIVGGEEVGHLELQIHDLSRGRNILVDELAVGGIGVEVGTGWGVKRRLAVVVVVGKAGGRRHHGRSTKVVTLRKARFGG